MPKFFAYRRIAWPMLNGPLVKPLGAKKFNNTLCGTPAFIGNRFYAFSFAAQTFNAFAILIFKLLRIAPLGGGFALAQRLWLIAE